ncbi:MAG: ATP-binding cassette domain-containing protein [Actinomycetota bacterium]|nr:ATP-binding cassette domain-containing protein [Actinomycetota bacterium]
MTSVAIELRGVTKTFPGAEHPAVAPIDVTMGAGEITVLIGPSGCGKTTTLRMVNRLIEPTAGTITIGGTDVRQQSVIDLRRGIGYVIQQVGLFPHRTIAQNIAAVPALLGWTRDRTRQRVAELAELVGLEGPMLARYPAELSGGQQQRVGVARALAADPPVLLMDEPFGAVDPIVRGRLQRELLDLQARVHKTIVLVTHDIDEAITLGDKVAVLNVGGVLEQFAAPDELLAQPANDFVASFLGAERSLKRLSLSQVADLTLDPGPVVAVTATVGEAKDALVRNGTEWLGLISAEGDFTGWIRADDLDGASDLAALQTRRTEAVVGPDSTLRQALEVILNSRSEVAVVLEDDRRYLGAVTVETIRRGLG